MENRLPDAIDELFSLAQTAADALHTLEIALGVHQNTEAVVRADLASARAANGAHGLAMSSRLTTVETQTTDDRAGVDFVHIARDVLKPHFGRRYSQAWNQAGFRHNSLQLPTKIAERTELLQSLADFFAAHPAYEAASLGVTQQHAQALHDALRNDATAVSFARGAQRTARETRDAAVSALRLRLRRLIRELSNLMSSTDPRWTTFGLNVPGAHRTPDAPVDLQVAPGGPGHLQVSWPRAPLAVRYRVFKKVVEVDPEFMLARSVTDLEVSLNTFTSGSRVQVQVTAVNAAGESLPSVPVEQVVP